MLKQKNFLYQEVINSTIELIRRNHYSPGDKMPSERDLANKFKCNYHTIRKAVQVLCTEGVLEQLPRQGTFVKKDVKYLVGKSQPKVKVVSKRRAGVVVLSGHGDFPNSLLIEMEHYANQMGVQLDLCTARSLEEDIDISAEMKRNGCKSIIILMDNSTRNEVQLELFIKNSPLPIITGFQIEGFEKYSHETPEQRGVYMAKSMELLCRYLSQIGWEHVAFLSGEKVDLKYSRKFLDFSYCVNKFGISSLSGFIDDTVGRVDDLLKQWEKHRGKLAIICEDDTYAMRVLMAMHKHGWQLPEDAAVVGFNDFSFSAYTDPPLTTVKFPFKYLAQSLLQRAIDLAEGKKEYTKQSMQPLPELVIRESCGGGEKGPEVFKKLLDEAVEKGYGS